MKDTPRLCGSRNTARFSDILLDMKDNVHEKVKIHFSHIKDASHAQEDLAEAMQHNTSVRELELWTLEKSCKVLFESCISNSLLTLTLVNCEIGNDGCEALGKMLESNKTLVTLRMSLREKSFDENGFSLICRGLELNRSLCTLDFGGTAFHNEPLTNFHEDFRPRRTPDKKLNLCQQLCQSLQRNRNISHLRVANCGWSVGDSSGEFLSQLIRSPSHVISSLDVSGFPLFPVEIIAKALLDNRTITHLNVSGDLSDGDTRNSDEQHLLWILWNSGAISDCPFMGHRVTDMCQRNGHARRRVEMLMVIRKFRFSSLLSRVPKEVVMMIGQKIFATRMEGVEEPDNPFEKSQFVMPFV